MLACGGAIAIPGEYAIYEIRTYLQLAAGSKAAREHSRAVFAL
jgi:hypothetical protein